MNVKNHCAGADLQQHANMLQYEIEILCSLPDTKVNKPGQVFSAAMYLPEPNQQPH
jgi:hypothetical protein